MNSLVVQTSFLGDIVLTTPLIAELARRGPVDVLTTPEGACILRNNPDIRSIIDYDRRKRDSGITGFARTVSRIRNPRNAAQVSASHPTAVGSYDVAYLAQGSLRSALLIASSGISRRVGFNTSGRIETLHRPGRIPRRQASRRALVVACDGRKERSSNARPDYSQTISVTCRSRGS